jgi:hypothetical protein
MRGIAGWVGLGWIVGAGACSGEPPPARPELELCDDGIDNDGDSLVDCDDVADCGGLACRDTDVGDDDDDEPALVEILFDEAECCNFDYSSSDCPQKDIGTFSVINRLTDEEALLDVFCDRVGPEVDAVIQWKPEGPSQPRPTVANAPIAAESSVNMVGVFVCATGVNQTFTTECTIYVEAGESGEEAEYVFTIEGSTLGG